MSRVPTGAKLHVTSDTPVPLNITFNGFSSGSLEKIVKAATFEPAEVGLNFT